MLRYVVTSSRMGASIFTRPFIVRAEAPRTSSSCTRASLLLTHVCEIQKQSVSFDSAPAAYGSCLKYAGHTEALATIDSGVRNNPTSSDQDVARIVESTARIVSLCHGCPDRDVFRAIAGGFALADRSHRGLPRMNPCRNSPVEIQIVSPRVSIFDVIAAPRLAVKKMRGGRENQLFW